MCISPYLFKVVATAFASMRADSTMPIVFTNLFDFILFIMRIRSFSNSCCPAYVLIIWNIGRSNYRISLRQDYSFVRKKDIRVRMSLKAY